MWADCRLGPSCLVHGVLCSNAGDWGWMQRAHRVLCCKADLHNPFRVGALPTESIVLKLHVTVLGRTWTSPSRTNTLDRCTYHGRALAHARPGQYTANTSPPSSTIMAGHHDYAPVLPVNGVSCVLLLVGSAHINTRAIRATSPECSVLQNVQPA